MFNYQLNDLVEVDKINIFFNPNENIALVILGSKKCKMALPIWIGLWEADMLEIALLHGIPPRPLPYDLFLNLCKFTNTEINKVVIYGMEEDTYLAFIELERNGEIVYLDSRPSDAFNIAVRAGTPIFISKKLLEKEGISLEDDEDLLEFLKELPEESEYELRDFDDDFGKNFKSH